MNKTYISKYQLTFLTLMCACGLSVGFSPNNLISLSGRDLWIVVLISIPINLGICAFYLYLAKSMNGMSLSEYVSHTLGTFLGKFFQLLYLLFFMLTAILTYRVMGNLLVTELIPETPISFILAPFIFVSFYGVYKGIYTIARSSEILVPIMTLMFVSAVFILFTKAHPQNLLPVLENGFSSIPKTLSVFLSYTGLSLIGLFSFFPKNMKTLDGTYKNLAVGILFSTSMNFLIATLVVLIVGPKIGEIYYYPGYILAREVELGRILKRSDAFIVILWFLAIFINSTIYSYTTFKTAESLFNIKNKILTLSILGVLITYISQMELFNIIATFDFIKTYWFYITLCFGFLIPLFLIIVSKMRNLSSKDAVKRDHS